MAAILKHLILHLPSLIPKEPALTPRQYATFTDCVAQTRTDVLELARWIKQCQCNLLTVGRAIKYQLSVSSKSAVEDYDGIGAAVDALIKKTNGDSPVSRRVLTPVQIAKEIKCPGSQNEYRRTQDQVSLPTTLESSDLKKLLNNKERPHVLLQWLVLKQAELDVEAEQLVSELLFWTGVLKDLRTDHSEGEKFPTSNTSNASTVVEVSLGVEEDEGLRMTSCFVKRKDIAIEGILEQVAARYQHLTQGSKEKRPADTVVEGPGKEVQVREFNVKATDIARRDATRHDSGIDVGDSARQAQLGGSETEEGYQMDSESHDSGVDLEELAQEE
jgi:hypothetical protein